MNLQKDLEEIIDEKQTEWSIPLPNPRPDIRQYAIDFFSIAEKRVTAKPYIIYESNIIQDFLTGHNQLQNIYQQIKTEFEAGRDMSKYLSKGSSSIRPDHLLFDWNIMHLHLSLDIDPLNYNTP